MGRRFKAHKKFRRREIAPVHPAPRRDAITKRADEYAMQIRDAFRQKGIEELVVSPTNQQFVILSQEQARKLGQKYVFEAEGPVDDDHVCVRFCTSWSTKQEEVRPARSRHFNLILQEVRLFGGGSGLHQKISLYRKKNDIFIQQIVKKFKPSRQTNHEPRQTT